MTDLRQIQSCARCGACRSVCPVLREVGWESSGARGRLLIAGRLMEGGEPCKGDMESLNTCTTCGICASVCPAGVSPPKIVEGARKALASRGLLRPDLASLARRIADTGNPLGDASPRLQWLRGLMKPGSRPEYVYFAGCLSSYRFSDTARRTLDLLRPFGVAPLEGEVCCGSPLARTGQDAGDMIRRNMEAVGRTGAKGIVTGCAGCYATLKDYPWDVEVKGVPEFLAEHIDDLGLKTLDMTVTYHDPCHMGRDRGAYDHPRRIIKAICDIVEMKASKERSRCCGGGGGVRATYGDLSLKIARRRLQDVPEGAECIITSCPMCVRNLRDAGGNVVNLADLVVNAMKTV